MRKATKRRKVSESRFYVASSDWSSCLGLLSLVDSVCPEQVAAVQGQKRKRDVDDEDNEDN